MQNESIAQIASNLKDTALSLARHEDATEEINALLAMAECLEEIGAERNRPLTLEELDTAIESREAVFFEFKGFRADRFCDVEEDKWGIPFCFGHDESECESECVMVAISQYLYNPLELPRTRYNKTWRPWRSRPTKDESAAAKWDEAQEQVTKTE